MGNDTYMRPITIQFNSKTTPEAVMKIEINSLLDAVAFAEKDKERLNDIRLQVCEVLARIEIYKNRLNKF